jgi:hypothetical protein
MSADTKMVKITKIGSDPTPVPPVIGAKRDVKSRKAPAKVMLKEKKPKFGILKGGKTARNKPRFEAVTDPTSSPPFKKSHKLRILTEKGAKTRRAKIMDDAHKVPISKIRQTLRKSGLPIKDSTPEKLARKIYEDAQEAGMISS